MGSLFYINVPIREHEIELRQKEQHITLSKELENVKRKLSQAARQSFTADIPKRNSIDRPIGRNASIDNVSDVISTSSQLSQRESLPSVESDVDIYEGTADGGKKVNILVTQNTIEILDKGQASFGPVMSGQSAGVPMKKKDEEDLQMENLINKTFLEKHLEECLRKFVIYDATWGTSIDNNFAQISFTVNAERSEEIINFMLNLGIGLKYESTLSVCSAIVYYNEKLEDKKKQEALETGGESGGEGGDKNTFGSKFIASIKSRLTVAQVIQTVQSNAIMTFDFIVLIVVAGIIAGLGLLENSSVNLVASMLISPLMGPIMAGCFGAVIRDWKLVKLGVISEIVGLSLCLLVGFFFGVCVAWHPFDGPWAQLEKWPTDEMEGRAKLRGMVVGVFIAIPSGAGVALSILGGNAGSLVGVAISASLLPPAVNAGLFWGMATVISIEEQIHGRDSFKGCNDTVGPTNSSDYYMKNHKVVYCRNVLNEYGLMGICSFGLTILNIILILLTGAIVLKIKEVAPHTTRKTMNRFWKEDLKAMRDYNKEHGAFNQEALFNEISGAENSAELKIRLSRDHTYNQVTRRNVFGNGIDILENADRTASVMSRGDIEGGGGEFGTSSREPSIRPNAHHHHTASPGFFGNMFGFFGHRGSAESETVSEIETPGPGSPRIVSAKPSTMTRRR